MSQCIHFYSSAEQGYDKGTERHPAISNSSSTIRIPTVYTAVSPTFKAGRMLVVLINPPNFTDEETVDQRSWKSLHIAILELGYDPGPLTTK